MKTLVVGDMHQKQHLILPLVDAAIERLGVERVILLGDYCDDWNIGYEGTDAKLLLEGLELQEKWLRRVHGAGIPCDVLLGNHDMQYLLGERGPGTNMSCVGPVRELLGRMDVQLATHVDGWLASHAGLTAQFATVVMGIDCTELRWKGDAAAAPLKTAAAGGASPCAHRTAGAHEIARTAAAGNAPSSDALSEDADLPYSAASLADQLNRMLSSGDHRTLQRLNLCGRGRGGRDIPGPLWASTDELALDGIPGIDQIVGHTPRWTAGELEERGFGGERHIVCDTFSTTSFFRPIGDGSMILVDDTTHEIRFLDPCEYDCEPWGW